MKPYTHASGALFQLISRLSVLLAVWASLAGAQSPPAPDEIPLERCDRLPVVRVRIENTEMRFLVDTGATSILNLKSFTAGKSQKIHVSSWSGTASTSAREVTLPEFALSHYRLTNLKLPAIDLSPIGNACGGQIDGILGVDLLEKMGATIDLERRVARLGSSTATSPASDEAARQAEHDRMFHACVDAFNKGDAAALEPCIDPDVVLYTPWGEFNGRKEMLAYLQERYFKLSPPAQIEFRMKDLKMLGSAAWYRYDYSVQLAALRIEGRGTGVCRFSGGRWRILNMHNSRVEPASARP